MSYFANKALGDRVAVRMQSNMENTEESVAIKDAINEVIYSRFHSSIVDESEAQTILNVRIAGVQDMIIATNSQGFATFYRVYISIIYSFRHNGKSFTFRNPGYYDYSASLNSPLVTYNNRSTAIKEAAKQSIDRFVSQIGYSVSY